MPLISRRYSHRHLKWAAFFARQVGVIEASAEKEATSVFEEDVLDERNIHEGFVVYSIISSFAFLDAYANETVDLFESEIERSKEIADRTDTNWDPSHPVLTLRKLDNIGENPFDDRLPTLKKYQYILIFTNSKPYSTDGGIFQEVNTVRRLRNYFVHYAPEWREISYQDDSNHIEHEIGSSLQGKFDLNPFRDDDSRPFFPEQCMSHGCAEWCIETCLSFVGDFTDRIPLKSKPYFLEEDLETS